MKFVIVSGGTVSGLGKGTAISSLGVVLKGYGYPVTALKIDPYLNIDAGTMSPYEHGEVFVLRDGGEADLDLGNYERFLDVTLTRDHNLTSGKVYASVIARERRGEYLGKTVQMVPHVTDAVQEWIWRVARESEQRLRTDTERERESENNGNNNTNNKELIVLIELGGTVGDIESAVYLEAIQQLQFKAGLASVCHVHVGFVPTLGVVGEQKTKPCQHSVKLLREAGIKPDFLFCRSERPLEESVRQKLSLFCQTPSEHVVSLHDVKNSYKVPLLLQEQRAGELVLRRLGLEASHCDLAAWTRLAERVDSAQRSVRVAVVGKYTGLADSYLSVIKALEHASLEAGLRLQLVWVEATALEKTDGEDDSEKEGVFEKLRQADGVLVPGGFGDRGVEGKIAAAQFCLRENKPYFGICLGLQTAVIHVARDRLGLSSANSAEFVDNGPDPVVVFMPEGSKTELGGTMRLGSRLCRVKEGTLAHKLYGGQTEIHERHRHRYEVNPDYVARLEAHGLTFSGVDEQSVRMEIAEIASHPFFLACQFHPEFTSRPMHPNPLFLGFVLASAGKLEDRLRKDGGVLKAGAGWSN